MIDPPTARAAEARADRPLVTVVLASRDRERYLDEALASLERQTYPRLEILLVDDGTAGAPAAALRRFAAARADARLLRTGGLGAAAARARALEEAAGSLFTLQDDDDRSHPERIERQVRHLERHPEIGALGTAADVIDERGARLGAYPVPVGPAAVRRALARRAPFVHGSLMMRPEAYRAAGGYRAAFPVAEDYDLTLRLAEVAELDNLPEALYAWRLHPGNTLARLEAEHRFYHAAARAFRDERARTGADSAAALERLGPEAFLARYPEAGRLLVYLGEAYARTGRVGPAWGAFLRALARPGARGRAILWSALSVAIPVARRLRGVRTTRGFAVPRESAGAPR